MKLVIPGESLLISQKCLFSSLSQKISIFLLFFFLLLLQASLKTTTPKIAFTLLKMAHSQPAPLTVQLTQISCCPSSLSLHTQFFLLKTFCPLHTSTFSSKNCPLTVCSPSHHTPFLLPSNVSHPAHYHLQLSTIVLSFLPLLYLAHPLCFAASLPSPKNGPISLKLSNFSKKRLARSQQSLNPPATSHLLLPSRKSIPTPVNKHVVIC